MRESLTMYDPEERGIKLVPAVPMIGDTRNPDRPYRNMRNTYNTEEELFNVVMDHQKDWDAMAPEVVEWDERGCTDADTIIVSHGVVARASIGAYEALRAAGKKVGYFRPITVRPFPGDQLRKAVGNAKRIFVPESSYGQLVKTIQASIYGSHVEIVPMYRPGLGITTEEIIAECGNHC